MLYTSNIVYAFYTVLLSVDWAYSKSDTEMYLATTHYEILLKNHESVMNALEKLFQDEMIRLNILKRHLRRYRLEHHWAMMDTKFMENPLNAFTVIKRLTSDLKQIKELIQFQIDSAYYFEDTINAIEALPTETDLIGAVLGVRRIQATYKLNVRTLSEGKIYHGGVVTESLPMTANDCNEMSRILYEHGDFHGAKAWAKRSIWKDKIEGNENEYTVYEARMDLIDEQLELAPNTAEYEVWDEEVWNMQAALCRNEMEIPRNISKRLTCYLSRSNPFLLLAPVKTEQLFTNPDIFLYHDVISDDEIDHLKELSKAELMRAEENATENRSPATYRTCKHMWIPDEMSPVVVSRINRRVTDLTGLSVKVSDDLQIVNYGIGGHYDAHLDFDKKDEPSYIMKAGQGNRIATVLFYMSDVTQGGATVFHVLGLSVFPVKKAALVWTNLLPSGEGDLNTLHAACPVLIGTKWTATKWIYQPGQEFITPCNLEYQREEDVRPIPKPILRIRSDRK